MFDGGTLDTSSRAAEEATAQAVAQYRSTVLVAFQNVADVLRALQADARAVSAAVDGGAGGGPQHRSRAPAGRAGPGRAADPAQRAAGLSADIARARTSRKPRASPTPSRCSRRSAAAGGTGGKPRSCPRTRHCTSMKQRHVTRTGRDAWAHRLGAIGRGQCTGASGCARSRAARRCCRSAARSGWRCRPRHSRSRRTPTRCG